MFLDLLLWFAPQGGGKKEKPFQIPPNLIQIKSFYHVSDNVIFVRLMKFYGRISEHF